MEQVNKWEFISLAEIKEGDVIRYRRPDGSIVCAKVKSLKPFVLVARILKGRNLSPWVVIKKRVHILGKSILVLRRGPTSENGQTNVPALAPPTDKDYAAKIERTLSHGRNT